MFRTKKMIVTKILIKTGGILVTRECPTSKDPVDTDSRCLHIVNELRRSRPSRWLRVGDIAARVADIAGVAVGIEEA